MVDTGYERLVGRQFAGSFRVLVPLDNRLVVVGCVVFLLVFVLERAARLVVLDVRLTARLRRFSVSPTRRSRG
jgi:hypothetical protein